MDHSYELVLAMTILALCGLLLVAGEINLARTPPPDPTERPSPPLAAASSAAATRVARE